MDRKEARERYQNALKALKKNKRFVVLYDVHHTGENGFQHGYQLHGYADGLMRRHLESLGLPFFYEYRVDFFYHNLVPDGAKLKFTYILISIQARPENLKIGAEYGIEVSDQDKAGHIYLTANIRLMGPAENLLTTGKS
jgi:hypothetical protein